MGVREKGLELILGAQLGADSKRSLRKRPLLSPVEVEVDLRRRPRQGDQRRLLRQADSFEVATDRGWVCDRSYDPHAAPTLALAGVD
ncbi:MAG: hypothetical protein MUC50_20895 [Myxococcota bacterium]|nr:hypothetical protein [Myxococcota bacterium]